MGVSIHRDSCCVGKADIRSHDGSLSASELITLSAYGASAMTRTCSRLAFEKRGRSLQASDLSEEVPVAFGLLFNGDTPEKL